MGFFPKTILTAKKQLAVIPQCGACGLYKHCESPKMPVSGSGKLKILFVGESPTKNDDEQGKPFSGHAGQCLRDMLAQINVDLDDCWHTNSIICSPNGKMESKFLEYCRPNLTNAIARLKPHVIIPLGIEAISTVIGPEWGDDLGQIKKWVGWTIPSPMHKAWVCPTYAPAFVLRANEDLPLVAEVIRHLDAAVRLLDVPCEPLSVSELSKQVEIITDPRLGQLRMKELTSAKGNLAFDFETTGLKPERPEQRIVCCSFCLDGKDTFCVPINEDSHEVLSKVLLNPGTFKIGSNLKFETRWAIQKLGHPVANCWHDSMLAAHYSDNRDGITSIKFQAYVRFGIGDYSSSIKPYLKADEANGLNQIHKAPVQALMIYCGLDSLLEYKTAMLQRAEMRLP